MYALVISLASGLIITVILKNILRGDNWNMNSIGDSHILLTVVCCPYSHELIQNQ